MDEDIKPFWLDMSEARLQRHLTEKKYPLGIMRGIITRVRYLKATRRKSRIKATVTQQMWDDILRAARQELARVRTSKAQLKSTEMDGFMSNGGQAKFNALNIYGEAITEVIAKLRKLREAGDQTPKQFAAYIKQETGRVIPNDGVHWSDYVSAKLKEQIVELFDKAPSAARGKKKVPFERTVSAEENAIQRAFLSNQLTVARTETEDLLSGTEDPVKRKELKKILQDIHFADHKLDIASRTAFLPRQWRGLLSLGVVDPF